MISKFALLSNLFLAFVALAAPPSQLGAPRGEDIQSHPSDRSVASVSPEPVEPFNTAWAGAQGNTVSDAESFNYIFGSFIVPLLNPDRQSADVSGFGVAVVLGNTNTACRSVILSGIEIKFENRMASYQAVYGLQLDKTVRYPYDPGSIMPGDEIKLSAHALSDFSGVAMVENIALSNGRQDWIALQGLTALPENPLCRSAAEWIVYDYVDPDTHRYVPFANFGRVIFLYGNTAKIDFTIGNGIISNVTPRDATFTNIVDTSDHILTTTSTEGILLIIDYIGRSG